MAEPRARRPRKRLPPASSPIGGTVRLGLVLAVLVGINLYVFLWRGDTSIPAVMEQAAMADKQGGVAEQPAARAGATAGKGQETPGRAEGDDPAVDDDDLGEADPGRELPEKADTEGRWVTGQVQPGDSMGRILRRENMSPPEADEVIRALGEHMDLRKIRPGQPYRVHFDDEGRLIEFEFQISRTLTVRAERDASGKLVAKKIEASTERRVREVGGRIENSLYAAMKRQGQDTSLVAFFVDVFAYDLNFYTDTHQGDTFRILVETEHLGEEFLHYGRVLAAEYSGKAGTHRAFYWQQPGEKEGRYYDAEGHSVERSLLKTPLKYAHISSRFNPNRMHPILHRRQGHMGVDYAAPTGTPVWAASSGKITFRGWRGGAGNCVIINHDNGLQTVYMHLSSFRKGQQVGQRVAGKTVIGYVGSTGMSTGPHLHFGVKKNGRYVDPLSIEPTRRTGVPAKHRARFKADTRTLVQRLERIALPGSG
jgi:murein DD-endopeptidase MepM/ murein hydrolase activator NlpD